MEGVTLMRWSAWAMKCVSEEGLDRDDTNMVRVMGEAAGIGRRLAFPLY